MVLAIIWWNWKFFVFYKFQHIFFVLFVHCALLLWFSKLKSLQPKSTWNENINDCQILNFSDTFIFFCRFLFAKRLLLEWYIFYMSFCYCLLSHKNVGDIQLLQTCCIKVWLKTYIKYLTFKLIGSYFCLFRSFVISLSLNNIDCVCVCLSNESNRWNCDWKCGFVCVCINPSRTFMHICNPITLNCQRNVAIWNFAWRTLIDMPLSACLVVVCVCVCLYVVKHNHMTM